MKTIGDEVMAHAAADTYSTWDGLDFLELSHANENNAAGNLYLAALGIIRKKNSINAELVEALEAALKTVEFEKHPFRPWHEQARAVLAKAKNPV